MLELLMAIAAVVAMTRIASADDQSPWIWGGLTIVLVVLCLGLIPLPFVRVGVAFGLAFIGMFVYKVVADR